MSFKVFSINSLPTRISHFYNPQMETVVLKLDGSVGESFKWKSAPMNSVTLTRPLLLQVFSMGQMIRSTGVLIAQFSSISLL